MIFKTVCGNFWNLNWCWDILTLADFAVSKNCFHCKITDKMRATKNKENSANRFGENYLEDHLVEFL